MKAYHWYIISILCILLGGFIGNNLSIGFLKIKTDGIGLDQLLTIIITLFIGWYIPSRISKIIEDKRVIKNNLVDEISLFLIFIKEVKTKINKCFTATSISVNDKAEINLIFEEADLLLVNLQSQVDILKVGLCNDAINAYTQYWQSVTGGNLMNQTYVVVDPEFNSRVIIEHYKMEITFKQLSQKIQKED